MTNKEFYKDELKEIKENFLAGIISVNKQGKPYFCNTTSCYNYIFSENECSLEKRKEWLNAEHIESVDWSKVKVDTPIYVRNNYDEEWTPHYFAGYDCGYILAWTNGATSFTTDIYMAWKYAMLAESED